MMTARVRTYCRETIALLSNTAGLLQYFVYSAVNTVQDSRPTRRYCNFISTGKIKTNPIPITADTVLPNKAVSRRTITLHLRAALFHDMIATDIYESPTFSDVINEYLRLAVFSELGKLATHAVFQTNWSSARGTLFHALRSAQVERYRSLSARFKTIGISPSLMLIITLKRGNCEALQVEASRSVPPHAP